MTNDEWQRTEDGGQKAEVRRKRRSEVRHGESVRWRIRDQKSGCAADLAIMQTDQLRFSVKHQDEEIIVVVLRDIDRFGYFERFDQVRYRISVTDD
jgi:hypothetical protein